MRLAAWNRSVWWNICEKQNKENKEENKDQAETIYKDCTIGECETCDCQDFCSKIF